MPIWGALAAVASARAITSFLAIVIDPREYVDGRFELGWSNVGFDIGEHSVLLVASWVAVWLAIGRVTAGDLGLVRVPWQSASTSAACLYVAYLLVIALFIAIAGEPPQTSATSALRRVDSVGLLAGLAVASCLVAPLTEEILFRGVVFTALRRRLARAPAVLAGGVVFGVVHGPPVGSALELVALGVVLCLLYDQTGSIVPCIGLHVAHNALAFSSITELSLPVAIVLTAGAVTASFAVVVPFTTHAATKTI